MNAVDLYKKTKPLYKIERGDYVLIHIISPHPDTARWYDDYVGSILICHKKPYARGGGNELYEVAFGFKNERGISIMEGGIQVAAICKYTYKEPIGWTKYRYDTYWRYIG